MKIYVAYRERPSLILAALGMAIMALLLVGSTWALTGSSGAFAEVYISALARPVYLLQIYIPICLTGLAGVVAYRAKFWNIGQEGQLIVGAIACLYGGLASGDSRIGVLVGALAGAAWGLVAGALRAYANANEAVVTFMLNLTSLQLLYYVTNSLLKDPGVKGFPITYPLPYTMSPAEALLYSTLAVLAIAILMRWTSVGLYIKILGEGERVATYAGVPIRRTVVLVSAVSGLLAGFGGSLLLATYQGYLQPKFSPGYGYMGIAASWLGMLNPVGVALASFFVASTYVGVDVFKVEYGIPTSVAQILMGFVIISAMLSSILYKYKVRVVL